MTFVSFIDGLALAVILVFAIFGFYRGFVEEFGKLLGLIVSSVTALKTYVSVTVWLSNLVPIDAWLLLILSFILVFSGVLIGMRLLTKILQFMLVRKSSRWANRSLGFFFGGIKGAVILAVCLWIVDLSPMDTWSDILRSQSKLGQKFTVFRTMVITAFHWDDPVKEGEDFIRNMLKEDSTAHE